MAEKNTKPSKSRDIKAGSKVIKSAKKKPLNASKGMPSESQATSQTDKPLKPEGKETAPDYVIVRPPPTIDPHRSSEIFIIVVSVAVTILGIYAAWPLWSPYVADHFPGLEYKASVDPRVAGLVGRLDALEEQTSGSIVKSITISDMENERERLQGEVGQLLKRLDSIDKTIIGVKELVKAINDEGTIGETKRAIDQITQRLTELEREGFNFGKLNSRLDQLEIKSSQDSNDAVKKVVDTNKNITSLIGDLEGRVHSLEVTGHPTSTTRADAIAIMLAVNQLIKSNLMGKPLKKDMNVLFNLSKDHPDMLASLSILEKAAKIGAPSIAILRAEFEKISGSVVYAKNEDKENNWFESTKKRVLSLISIRKIDIASDEITVDAFVVQIEKYLSQGNLAAAIKMAGQIKGVSEPAVKIVAPWLEGAKNRLMVERAVASLHVYAMSLMTHGKK